AALEAAPVGSLVAKNLGAFQERTISEHECSAFSAPDVLRFVEADGAADAERAEGTAAKRGTDRLRGVLDDGRLRRGGSQLVQVARVAPVMDRNDGSRPGRDDPSDVGRIEIAGPVDVGKEESRPAQEE